MFINVNIVGEADKVYASVPLSSQYIIKPTDFHGLTPKLKIKVGNHLS